MALARRRDVAYAIQLCPLVDCSIVAPDIIEPLETVGTTKTRKLSIDQV